MPEVSTTEPEPTISSIDENVSRLNGRLHSLLDNLKSATRGEQPETEDSNEKESIPSSSIDSINRRLNDAHDIVDIMERFMTRFHS